MTLLNQRRVSRVMKVMPRLGGRCQQGDHGAQCPLAPAPSTCSCHANTQLLEEVKSQFPRAVKFYFYYALCSLTGDRCNCIYARGILILILPVESAAFSAVPLQKAFKKRSWWRGGAGDVTCDSCVLRGRVGLAGRAQHSTACTSSPS